MYARAETDQSHRYLLSIVNRLDSDYCLIGGWAVYYLVNDLYRKATMRDYLGSKDIDIGVPDIDAMKTIDEILTKEMGFEHLSFRFVKYLDYETGDDLDPERAKTIPLHMLIELFVDIIVPQYTKDLKTVLGFIPPDEPILGKVFKDEKNRMMVSISEGQVRVPSPEMILSMKFNSIGDRTKDHKRIKDLCDIVALCLFSGIGHDHLIERGLSIADPKKIGSIHSAIVDEDIIEASRFLGIPRDAIQALVDKFSNR